MIVAEENAAAEREFRAAGVFPTELEGSCSSASEEISSSMRASFAGGREETRLPDPEFELEDEDAEQVEEEVEEEEECTSFGEARFSRLVRRKRSIDRSRGSVKSSGASAGNGGRSPAK